MRSILILLSMGLCVAALSGCSRGVDAGGVASRGAPPTVASSAPLPAPVPATPTAATMGGEGFARLNVPFETMVAEARGRGKPAILYVCATWCGACSRMNREVLSDARVRERLRAFPTAQYDPNTPAGRALADRYDIWAYPEMVLVDGSGRELQRIKGAGDPTRMLRILGAY